MSTLIKPFTSILIATAVGCTDHGLKIHEAEPKASLLSPGENETFLEGSPVAFRVQLDDNDDGAGALEVAWRSDSMGTLRGDAMLGDDNVQEFVTEELSRGPHVITVTATDPDGNTASDDVAITVSPNSAPQIGLSAVFAGDFTAYGVGEALKCFCTGSARCQPLRRPKGHGRDGVVVHALRHASGGSAGLKGVDRYTVLMWCTNVWRVAALRGAHGGDEYALFAYPPLPVYRSVFGSSAPR